MNILQLSIFVTFSRKISGVAESARSQEKDAKKKKGAGLREDLSWGTKRQAGSLSIKSLMHLQRCYHRQKPLPSMLNLAVVIMAPNLTFSPGSLAPESKSQAAPSDWLSLRNMLCPGSRGIIRQIRLPFPLALD